MRSNSGYGLLRDIFLYFMITENGFKEVARIDDNFSRMGGLREIK